MNDLRVLAPRLVFACLLGAPALAQGDWPMWGGDETRSMASDEVGLPSEFFPGEFVGAPAFGYGHFVTFPLAGTAAKRGTNKLGVKLAAINPQLPKLAASPGVKESDGGIAVGVIEARYGYTKAPDRGRPGAWPQP